MKKIYIALMCLFISPFGFSAAFYADGDTTYVVIPPRTNTASISEFEHEQEQLLAWVRDVNYYTHVGVTERDTRMLRTFLDIVTLGLSNAFIDELTYGLSTRVLAISTDGIELLKNEGIERSLSNNAVALGLEDLYDRIVKRPFVLLLLGEDQYNDMIEVHPEVKTLFDNMWTFFYYRAVVLGEEFNKHIDDIERMSRRAKANPFKLWNVLAQYAQKEFDTIGEEKIALHNLKYHMQIIQTEEKIRKEVEKLAQHDKNYPSKHQLHKEKQRKRQSQTIKGRAKTKYNELKNDPDSLKHYLQGID